MDSPLVELVRQISRLDWYEAGAFSDVRDLERMTAQDASPTELLRTLRDDRSRLQDILPTAHRLIGHAADFATLADGTPAGAALDGRAAAFERLTASGGPLDRLRQRVAAWAEDTFRHMLRQWGEPGYEFDEWLWPAFDDRCGRDGAAPPDCQFELLILRKLFGSLDPLRLNFPEAVRWLTLYRSIPWAPRPASDDDRDELLGLTAQSDGDHQHGCWLVAKCRTARQQDGELRRLAVGLCRWPAYHQRSILKAVKALAPLGWQAAMDAFRSPWGASGVNLGKQSDTADESPTMTPQPSSSHPRPKPGHLGVGERPPSTSFYDDPVLEGSKTAIVTVLHAAEVAKSSDRKQLDTLAKDKKIMIVGRDGGHTWRVYLGKEVGPAKVLEHALKCEEVVVH